MISSQIYNESSSGQIITDEQRQASLLIDADGRSINFRQRSPIIHEFQRTYYRSVGTIVDKLLFKKRGQLMKLIFHPIWYTLKNRRNFFRSGLLISVGQLSKNPSILPYLGACVEIAWTCALIIDDIYDSSQEREGQICAYLIFGATRCIVAVIVALSLVFFWVLFRIPGSFVTRMDRAKLSIAILCRCMHAQFRGPQKLSIKNYRNYSREVNLSILWSLTVPFCGYRNTRLIELMKSYAKHSAIAGKMRNDIVDYWGGSSERDTVFEDFRSMKISFPILLLFNTNLDAADLLQLRSHFYEGNRISEDEIMEMFYRYFIYDKSRLLLAKEVDASFQAIEGMRALGVPEKILSYLERLNDYMEKE